ncbi:hypothetical protein [Actinocorallia longicatena]
MHIRFAGDRLALARMRLLIVRHSSHRPVCSRMVDCSLRRQVR